MTLARSLAYLCAEAVAYRADRGQAHLALHVLDGRRHYRVDVRRGMRVVAVTSVAYPLHQVKPLGPLQLDRVAVEQVQHHRRVALRRKLVRHELAVLPYANHVREVQNALAGDCLVGRCGGDVGVDLAVNLDQFARRLAPTIVSVVLGLRHDRDVLKEVAQGAASCGRIGSHVAFVNVYCVQSRRGEAGVFKSFGFPEDAPRRGLCLDCRHLR